MDVISERLASIGMYYRGLSMLDDLRSMRAASPAHIEVFAERYNQLLVVACSLAKNDRDQARDLVHDALVKFVRLSPDLHKISNIDSYLRTLVRNLFKSQKRRMNTQSRYELTIENFNSVENGLSTVADRYYNPYLLLQIQDLLRVICEYACFRKERLKLGSALILRFFHGYHTSEIAQIMGVTASAVSHQLKLAQAETWLYLNDPKRLNLSHEIAGIRGTLGLNYGCLVNDLVEELRRAIFKSPSYRECILHFHLRKLYSVQCEEEIDCKTLAHIVSCADCLDAVNSFLGLELLSKRYPADTLNRCTKDRKASRQAVAKGKTVCAG
jgi:RNA polymerase sigma factor (sigma-70 family)